MHPDPDGASTGAPAPRATRRGQAGIDDPAGGVFLAAVAAMPMPTVLSDPNQRDNPIVFANPAFLRLTGYARAEVLGRNCRFLQGPESDAGAIAEIRQAVRTRAEVSVELLNYRKDGTPFWNALFVSPVVDEGGDLVYFFASQLDVTRRRDAEEALRRAQALAAVGELAGGIAHDFNNLLQVIAGYTDRLKDRAAASGDADLIRQLEAVAAAADRGTALARQLLAASRERPVGSTAPGTGEVVGRPSAVALRRGGGRVLVVDDRAEVAELARTMLEDAGYAVDVARDGREALAKLDLGFDLLFSDLVMPGDLDGLGLAREARRRHAGLKVLLTTGQADAARLRADAGSAEFETIAKPYRRADLARTVGAMLDGPAATV